jgi:hypothetical protein
MLCRTFALLWVGSALFSGVAQAKIRATAPLLHWAVAALAKLPRLQQAT